jgi:hypothetical protein
MRTRNLPNNTKSVHLRKHSLLYHPLKELLLRRARMRGSISSRIRTIRGIEQGREKRKRWREEHKIQHSQYSDDPDAALGALDLLIIFNATSFIPPSPFPSLSLSLSLPPPRPRTDLDDAVRERTCRMEGKRERPLLEVDGH